MHIHKHHIIPRHMGGTDHPDNLVEVSIEQHAELHLSLYLEGGRWQDWVAYNTLSGQMSKKEAWKIGTENRVFTDETIKKMREAKLGKTTHPNQKLAASKAHKDRPKSEEQKRKTRETAIESHRYRRKLVEVIPPEGEPYVVEGINEICRQLVWKPHKKQYIRYVMTGEWKHYLGYRFRELDNK